MSSTIVQSAGLRIDRLLRMSIVADLLGVSKRTVYRLIAEGKLPQPVQDRGGSRLPESEVAAYVDRLKRERSG